MILLDSAKSPTGMIAYSSQIQTGKEGTTLMTTETLQGTIPETIFDLFKQWIAQPAKLNKEDYGGPNAAYWQERRNIEKQRKAARKALKFARRYSFNPEAMAQALKDAYAGRLTYNHESGSFEYCTGQYFPTEFAAAAGAVLEKYVYLVKPKFVPTPEQRGQWWTIDDIERANDRAGYHWFEPATKRFFRSRVCAEVYQGPGGIFFVTSEKGPHSGRAFTIREFKPETADIDTFGPFNTLSRSRAQRLARIAADYREAAKEALEV